MLSIRTTLPLLCAAAASALLPVDASAEDRLETVIVRAAREPIDADRLGSSVSLLDTEQLEKRQTAALADVLRSVPGLAVNRAGGIGGLTQVRMRGAESNHTLVFIDGVRANDPAQNGEFNFAHLLNRDIESVEVIRGPQSSLWGSDALAGVINIRTRRAGLGLDGAAYAEGGENGWQNVGADARYGGQRLKLSLGVSDLDSDGHNLSRSGEEEDGYRNTTANGSVQWSASETLGLEGNLRYVDASNEYDNTDFGTGLPADSDSETDVEQIYARLAVKLDTLDGGWRHRASLALTDTGNTNRSEDVFAATGFDTTRADAEVVVFTLQSSVDLADGHTLTAAWERWQEDFRQRGQATVFGNPNRDESMDTDSVIFEYRGQLTQRLSVQASARRDDNSDFDDKTTGRFSTAWLLDDNTTLRGAWGTGIKNPTFTERFGFFTNFVGNPDLKPEESRGWEVGADRDLLSGRMALSATWFDEELEDEINGFAFDPAIGDFTAINETGKSRRRGLELAGRWQIGGGLTVNAAYTWLDAEEDDGSDEIRRPEHTASANLNWDFAGGRGNLNLQLDYNGEQHDLFFPPAPPFQERVELDDFTLLTVAGSYRVADGLEVYARIENATDEEYEEIFGFRSPGRLAIAGMRYRFRP